MVEKHIIFAGGVKVSKESNVSNHNHCELMTEKQKKDKDKVNDNLRYIIYIYKPPLRMLFIVFSSPLFL